MLDEDLLFALALQRTPNIGDITAKKLIGEEEGGVIADKHVRALRVNFSDIAVLGVIPSFLCEP